MSTKAGRHEYHPLIREATKDFLVDSRKLHGTSAGKILGPMTQEHKAKLSAASVRKRTGTAESLAIDVKVESFKPAALEQKPDEDKDAEEDIEKLLENIDSEDFLSIQPPEKKKARSAKASKGRGRGHGPRSAEEAAVEVAIAELADGDEDEGQRSE